ncbi:MAG TPA: TMEM14 family protein [bacterium]
MSYTATIVAAYGTFTILGGIIGYVKARSVPSLIAGVGLGGILLLCASWILEGRTAGSVLSLLIALALAVRFLGTWKAKRRVMPDALMVLFSAAALGSVLAELLRR